MGGMDHSGDVLIVRPHRRPSALVASLVAVVLLVGAGVGGWLWWREHTLTAQARECAAAVAAAVAAGKLPACADVADRAAAQKALGEAVAGMSPMEHTVEVALVNRSGDAAEAVFAHRWRDPAGGHEWAYQTRISLSRTGEGWRGKWQPDIVAPNLASGEHLRAVRLPAQRGEILGADGAAIVTARPVVRVGIDKTKVDEQDAEASARALAQALGVQPGPYVAAVRDAGPRAFVEAIALREDAPEVATLAGILSRIPGSLRVSDTLPLAPTPAFARPILGTVGPATAEIVAASKGKVRAGDVVGLSGLQATRDEQLRGIPGLRVETGAPGGTKARTLFDVTATDGSPVRVSLDERVQLAAEAALSEVAPPSAIVAIRPSDGHVLAAASGPGSQGQSTATLGRYAPGSTFKVVTTLGLLRAGVTPTSELPCPTTITVDGRVFGNHTGYPSGQTGPISLAEALAQSCNTAFIGARSKLPEGALADAAAALGMTTEPALGVPAAMGSVPRPASEVEAAAAMIGQGKVTASPLAMATVAASIARGSIVHPALVIGGASGDGAPASSAPPVPAKPFTAAEGKALRELMRGVVTTGTAQALEDLPGVPVMAKTGTAEYGNDQPPRTHAWMIAIQGDLAVAAFVEDGEGGAATAGPVLADLLRQLAGS